MDQLPEETQTPGKCNLTGKIIKKKPRKDRTRKHKGNVYALQKWRSAAEQLDNSAAQPYQAENDDVQFNNDEIRNPRLNDDSIYEDFIPLSPENSKNIMNPTFSLKTTMPEKDSTSKTHLDALSGRRIIDIEYMFKSISSIHHKPFDCTFQNLIFKFEIRKSFFSEFHFECEMCSKKEILFSESPTFNKTLAINAAIVSATLNIGQGHSQLDQFSAILNMPCMSNKTYQKEHEFVARQTQITAWEAIEAAGKEEAKLAVENGEVNDDGVPMITVVADGAWSKRSYKHNYNALSGVACIVGYRTKKVLFIGVRNKYCSICMKAASLDKDPPNHTCYKNWNNTSTAMEADIIVEGFRQSMEMHNIIYQKLIGDGDSSVFKKNILSKPYGFDFEVQKIECANHILRNYMNRIVDMSTRRKSSSGDVVPGILRKNLKEKRLKLRCAITNAIKYRMQLDAPFNYKVTLLREDIENGPYHVFGSHDKCANYFCTGPKLNELNQIPEMEKCGLWQDILGARNLVAHHADSLIHFVNNNCVESYNNVVAKYVGGKRVNFSFRGSYKTRCDTAVNSFNLGPSHLRHFHKKATLYSPGMYTKKYIRKIEQEKKKVKSRKLQLRKPGYKIKRNIFAHGPDDDYGAVDQPSDIIDMTNEEYAMKKKMYLSKLKLTGEQMKNLERSTTNQSQNDEWRRQRKMRLTASNFGKIVKLRATTSRANAVKYILYDLFRGNAATRYGIQNEPLAKIYLEKRLETRVQACGIFIDTKLPYLAASPDGLINDDSIVEIKCPVSIKDYSPEEAFENKKLKFLSRVDGHLRLKTSHDFFYQIQGQLHITNKKFCYFAVWSPKGIIIDKIERDDVFWKSMEPKLESFFMNCLLPEIIDPRLDRGLPLRTGL